MALTHVLQVGETCPGLAQLSVINARVVVGRGRDHCARESSCALFPRLQQLYLYLVQYLPALSLGCPAPSVTTGLHLLLSHAPLLTSLQCPGSPLLTDKVQTQQYFQLSLTLLMSPRSASWTSSARAASATSPSSWCPPRSPWTTAPCRCPR